MVNKESGFGRFSEQELVVIQRKILWALSHTQGTYTDMRTDLIDILTDEQKYTDVLKKISRYGPPSIFEQLKTSELVILGKGKGRCPIYSTIEIILTIISQPLENLAFYINTESLIVKTIVTWRMEIGK